MQIKTKKSTIVRGVFCSCFGWLNVKSFFKRPTRNFSHYIIMIIFAVVVFIGVVTPQEKVATEATQNNPFSTEQKNQEINQVTYVQSVATIASVIDEEMGRTAYTVATKEEKPVIAVSGNNFLVKPVLAENREGDKPKNDVQEYVVQDGDTLWTIARDFDLTTDTIRWANDIEDEDYVKPGQTLLIPPTVGVLHAVVEGDTLESIAEEYGSSVSLIISQNDLYGDGIAVGMKIMVPDGVIEEAPESPAYEQVAVGNDSEYVPSSVSYSQSSYNSFPYGYCTWYVASRRNVPWNGNAWQWYGNAITSGYSVGSVPVPGAIMVTWESWVGHVALVESVSGSSFTVSEMNYAGWGIVSYRTVTTSSVPLIGFVY